MILLNKSPNLTKTASPKHSGLAILIPFISTLLNTTLLLIHNFHSTLSHFILNNNLSTLFQIFNSFPHFI